MKDLTYIKVKEGKLWASDMVKPAEPPNWAKGLHFGIEYTYEYEIAKEDFNKSFIKVGNPEFMHQLLPVKGAELVEGIQPVSGLQFEVREDKCSCKCHPKNPNTFPNHIHPVGKECCINGFKKVAILSLKQEPTKRFCGCASGEDCNANCVVPEWVAKRVLAARDAHIKGDHEEVYHQLYSIANPEFDSLEPWKDLETMAKQEQPSEEKQKAVDGEKEERIELLEIELSNTKILLEACESALAQRDSRIKALEERLEKVTKIINHELAEIPKLQDFASKHGDAQGYARICGQEIILERLKTKLC